jgi:hypothetical protein
MESQAAGVTTPTAGSSSTTNTPSTTPAAGGKAPAAAAGAAGTKATTPSTAAATGGAGSPAAASGSAGTAAAAAGSGGAAASTASAAAGTSGSAGGGAAASGPTFTAVYNALFVNSAAAGCYGCHSGMSNPALNGNFSMVTDKAAAYKGLVGAASSPDSMCKEMTRVSAGDPMKSLLYQKIAGTPSCGMKMPPGGTPLPAEVVTLVKDWITAGAKDD